MYKNSLINFPTAIKNQKNIIDQQALNNLILHTTKLHDSATRQQKLIDQVKSEHDKIASKLDEIEKNIESLNNMEVPDNIKEMLLVECGHFPAVRFNVQAVGIYPGCLLSFPRSHDEDFSKRLEKSRLKVEEN